MARTLRPAHFTYGTWTFDLLPFLSDNREKLLLKPASSYGGRHVARGIETGQDRCKRSSPSTPSVRTS